jgi:hypothetical protein
MKIILTKNKYGHAHYFAGYIMGMEIFLRMTKAELFWEFSKYAVIIFFLAGIIAEKKKSKPDKAIFLYIFLLAPAAFMADSGLSGKPWRELVASSLSGPASLAMAVIYFYRRPFSMKGFLKLALFILMPLITSLTFLVRNFMDLGSVTFKNVSNYEMTAGFGPNQVSSALAFAVVLIFIFFLLGKYIILHKFMDWILAAGFLVFSILTFSRGGVISAGFACLITILLSQVTPNITNRTARSLIFFMIAGAGILQIWQGLNVYTKGALQDRYDFSRATITDEYAFTHRKKIFLIDIEIFKENPVTGVGAGMGNWARIEKGLPEGISAHTEFSRALAEHGTFGLLALFFLFWIPIRYFRREKNYLNRVKFVALISYSFLTMSHSAMRLALPGFLYGMAFLDIQTDLAHGPRLLWLKKKFQRPHDSPRIDAFSSN